jgi:hypothetical protein
MPCYDVNYDEIACTINGAPNSAVVSGVGEDYEEYEAALKSSAEWTDAPPGKYDAQGRYYESINGSWVPNPTFDDERESAAYRAPSTAQPPTPYTYPDRNGDVVGVDEQTGQEVYRIPGAQWATISPQEQERIRQGDIAAAQRYGTAEREAGQAFTSGENALGRALQAGQFASQLGGQNQERAFSADQAYQQAQERYTSQQLGAAQQVADNISNVDQAALPAFYAAGGGVISNALAGGATAQTDMANFGSARALRLAENAAAPERFAFSPVSFDPRYGMGGGVGSVKTPVVPSLPTAQQNLGAGIVPTAGNSVDFVARNTTPEENLTFFTPQQGNGMNRPAFVMDDIARRAVPAMAVGGVGQGMAVVGEDGPELVMSSGPFMVMNRDQLGFNPERMSVPKAADGGAFGFDVNSMILPADQPYIDRIRKIRSGVDTSNPLGIGPFNTQYRTLAPSLQRRQAAAYQTAYGVPTEDFFAEEQRFRVPGSSRGAFALSY